MATKFVTTMLEQNNIWNNQDKSKNKMLQFNLLSSIDDDGKINDFFQFSFRSMGDDGKFSNTFNVNLMKPASHLLLKFKEFQRRVEELLKGKTMDSEGVTIHNKGSIKEATAKVTLDAYSSKDKGEPVVVIKLATKKDKDSEEEKKTYYFGKAKVASKFNNDSYNITDYEFYAFITAVVAKLEAIVAGTSLTRDYHYKKCVSTNSGESKSDNNKKGDKSSSKKESYEDEDDFPY